MDAVRNGEEPPKPQKKWRIHHRRIAHLKREYRQGVKTLAQYWRAVARCISRSSAELVTVIISVMEQSIGHICHLFYIG